MKVLKIIAGTLFLLAFTTYAQAQKFIAYQGKISIDSLKILNADFDVKYFADTSEIRFYINKNATINSLTINGKNTLYQTEIPENFLPDLESIVIRTAPSQQTSDLKIQYSYDLTKIENPTFIYNPHWIELSFYTGWFPVNLSSKNYAYTLDFEIPENYKIISSGKITRDGNHIHIVNNNNEFDIPVVLSDEFQIFGTKNRKVQFYGTQLQPNTIADIQSVSENIYTFYEKRFGDCNSSSLIVAVNPFNHSMSYSRKGFISLSFNHKFSDASKRILAHEIGHLWWKNAPFGTWEEWLGESFAEYSSLIWAEQNMHEKDFKVLIAKYKNKYETMPKISEVKSLDDPNWNDVIYLKGAYMLYQLNKNIGDKKMNLFLRKTNQMKISNTKDLLNLLKTVTDEKTEEKFAKDIE